MNEPKAHWGRLQRRQSPADEPPETGDSPAEICAAIFTGPMGREFLAMLYAMTIDKRQRAGATDAELREAEAQRRLVADLERLRDQGLEARARAAQSH